MSGKQPVAFDFSQEQEGGEGQEGYGAFDIQAMIDAEKAKLKQANEQFLRELPKPVQQRVQVLEVLQDDYNDLKTQFEREVAELEKKYEKLYAPLVDRRRAIVLGEADVTGEEQERSAKRQAEKATSGELSGVQIEETTPAAVASDADVKGIPNFWKEVLCKSELMGELIADHDVPSLEHLRDIRIENFDDGQGTERSIGFHIDFYFNENPYFSNDKLRKTYFLDAEDKQTLQDAEGCEINWKDDEKNLTVKITVKTQRHKGGKGTRKVKKEEPRQSFYNFFKNHDQQLEAIPADLQEQMDIEDIVESDFEVGQMLRDDIMRRAVDYFTGKAALESIEHQLMPDFGEEDDEEDDEEDEDEEEVEQTRGQMGRMQVGGRGGRGGARGGRGGAAAGGAENPECKQQ